MMWDTYVELKPNEKVIGVRGQTSLVWAGRPGYWAYFSWLLSDGESDREVMTETTPCWYDNRTHGKCPVNPYE
jgi:hypothetical protein